MCAQPKVVLKVETEEDMLVLQVSILTIIQVILAGHKPISFLHVLVNHTVLVKLEA